MKTWTVVIEIQDSYESNDPLSIHGNSELENMVWACLSRRLENLKEIKFRIMETIEAPYGPQHPNGVFIMESKAELKPMSREGIMYDPGRAGRIKS